MIEWLLITFLFLTTIYFLIKNLEWKFKFEDRVRKHIEEIEEKIKREAIERSARSLSGKTVEKLVPIIKTFKHNPHDVRWLGDPIDFIVFDGLSEGKVKGITFVEVKSGKSKLNERERKIREAVEKKKVYWEEFKV
ncbi:MAG: Holliday junction resolvase-like protein [Candidatus Aenigmatarchaeota archaeon]